MQGGQFQLEIVDCICHEEDERMELRGESTVARFLGPEQRKLCKFFVLARPDEFCTLQSRKWRHYVERSEKSMGKKRKSYFSGTL